MVRVGLVVHYGRQRAVEIARDLVRHVTAAGVPTRALEGPDIGADEVTTPEVFPKGLDLVVSVGGDGTLLRAAELAARADDAPVLAVNVGRLGFLTAVGPAEAALALDEAIRGEAVIERRFAIVAEPESAPWTEPQWALNEVIVEKLERHRMITLTLSVDGHAVTTYSADGLIVSTPTGSTAYSFSAGGPIVSPRIDCLLVTPVSPHMLFNRPLLLAPDDVVTLEVVDDEPGLLSADGRRGLDLPVGSRVRIRAAERPVSLVRRRSAPGFFEVLREKFSLPAGEAPHRPPIDV
jgi:NAD+ kinase